MAKRKQVLIDPTVQWAIGRRLIVHWMLFLTCLLSVNAFLHMVVTLSSEPFWPAVTGGLRAQLPMVAVMLVLLPVFVHDTMKLSNRFAGPMFRLRSSIKALADGTPSREIAFRDGDFWQETAVDFNRLRNRVEQLEQENEELKRDAADAAEPRLMAV